MPRASDFIPVICMSGWISSTANTEQSWRGCSPNGSGRGGHGGGGWSGASSCRERLQLKQQRQGLKHYHDDVEVYALTTKQQHLLLDLNSRLPSYKYLNQRIVQYRKLQLYSLNTC